MKLHNDPTGGSPVISLLICLPLLGTSLLPPADTQEATVAAELDSAIVHVGLFKNGLTVVRRAVTLPGPGRYSIGDVPAPIHGTFWIESDGDVSARVTTRTESTSKERKLTGNIQEDLAGARVVVQRTDGVASVAGKLAPLASGGSNMLVLDTVDGRVYLDTKLIASVRVIEAAPSEPIVTVKEIPLLELSALDAPDGPISIEISYLTRGLTWTPSYRIDLSDPELLVLTQKTVISNELTDLTDVDVELISGYPNIEFGHVQSLLGSSSNIASFFSQLSNSSSLRHNTRGDIRSQITSNYAAPATSSAPLVRPSAEGVDMHYHPIGKIDLKRGERLMLPIAEATSPYERIVDWRIPDLRDEHGRAIDEYQRENNPRYRSDGVWDALRFNNPYDHPMTTAPALIVDGHHFNGQQTSTWVNPGQETTLRITKALSVRVSASESEVSGDRELVSVGRRNYIRPDVHGELLVCNHRKVPTTVVIRRAFSGKLLSSDADPEERLLESGVYSINPRNELVWTITLEPGETRTLEYQYSVLVLH